MFTLAKLRSFALACCLTLVALHTASAGPVIDIFMSVGPNPFASPSYEDYARNAIDAMENGFASAGTSGTPSYYEQVTQVNPGDILLTAFPSWKGQAPPTGAFAGEFGNALYFGIRAIDTVDTFTQNDISWAVNVLGIYTDSGFISHLAYNYDLVGYNGATRYDENNAALETDPIDKLYYVGVITGFSVADPGDLQGTKDAILGFSSSPVSAGYFAGSSVAVASLNVVPEPGTIGLLALGLGGLAVIARRRTRRS